MTERAWENRSYLCVCWTWSCSLKYYVLCDGLIVSVAQWCPQLPTVNPKIWYSFNSNMLQLHINYVNVAISVCVYVCMCVCVCTLWGYVI